MNRKLGIVLIFLFTWWQVKAQDDHDYLLKKAWIETENGIKLATDIYLQDENATYPVILARTPYLKDNFRKNAVKFVRQGYAVVVQDCRGKFSSEGEFYAFGNERTDGLKTVAWIKNQPWCNGKIAGYGSSYNTYTQWAISDQLDVVISELGSAGLYDLIYPQGLFSLATACNWGLIVDTKTVIPLSPEKITEKISKSYWYLPLSAADDSTFKNNLFFNDWVLHEKNDNYWKSLSHRDLPVKASVLSIAGWYDIFLLAQINDFLEIDRRTSHPNKILIIGPWCHGPQAFKIEYGGSSKTGRREPLQERFLAKNMQGKQEDVLQAPFTGHKYNFFIMERNEYVGCESWPPKQVKRTDYYLVKDRILPERTRTSGQKQFVYDPMDPYPSIGGTFIGMEVGPGIQNKNSERKDQWAFESDVLRDPLTLLGAISASLYVSSTAENTDFMILVQDVFPNDTMINIQEGGKQVKLDHNKTTRIDLESWPTGYQLNPGHKLRIVITSGWFPRYNRNLNKGQPIYRAKESETATQTIYFGPKYPSKISLPVLGIN